MKKYKSVWEYELLWNKCKAYAQKAMQESREDQMFPFWSALVLEFLGRATLAKVHPVLLADPREGDNILYVFGYSKSNSTPKSIVAKTVFSRCIQIVPNFTQKEMDICLALMDRRNEELHSGSLAFHEYDTRLWLADYYKVCKILLDFSNIGLIDLFGNEEAVAAEEMITETDKKLIADVKKRIDEVKTDFEKFKKEDRESKQKSGSQMANTVLKINQLHAKIEKCICCDASAVIIGKTISVSEAKLKDDRIIQENIILPTNFICYSCGIELNGHQELKIANYGGQFTVKEEWEPAEYHGIDTVSSLDYGDYYDYGND
jgi:hypothetical protein